MSANKLCLHTKLVNFALSTYIHGESLKLSVISFTTKILGNI